LNIPWDKVEQVFRIFFPEFSNKVTWAVVAAGLTLTTASIIEKIIEAVFKVAYDINIFGGNDAIVGFGLVALGLTHNIVLQREKTKIEISANAPLDNSAHRKHDVDIFERLNEIMDEDTLEVTLYCLEVNHAYFYSKYSPIEKLIIAIDKSDNAFSDDGLNDSMAELRTRSKMLNSFLVNNCQQMRHGTDDDYLCLHPYWNCDRDGSFGNRDDDIKYDKAMKEMFELINGVRVAYASYRKSIKSKLAV
jgi:hypothetical protein